MGALTATLRMIGRISITEKTCEMLMERILSGALPPGARLDANVIAAAEGVSPTPVRNALNRLVGAGVLVSQSNGGFFTPFCSEQDLRDAYDCVAALLGLAIARAAPLHSRSNPDVTKNAHCDEEIALQTEKAFREIMALYANRPLRRAFDDMNVRLRPVRLLEQQWIANQAAELKRIQKAHAALELSQLQRLIDAYHRRRIRLVRKIVARMRDRDGEAVISGVQSAPETA